MFTPNGEPLLCTDKAKMMHLIEAIIPIDPQVVMREDKASEQQHKVLIIDDMAVVNKLNHEGENLLAQTFLFCNFLCNSNIIIQFLHPRTCLIFS